MSKITLALLVAGILSACAVSPSARNNRLVRAAEKGRVDIMEQLIKDGADINGQDPDGWTPYLAASSNGQFEAMRLLRGLGAKTEAPEMQMQQFSFERRFMVK